MKARSLSATESRVILAVPPEAELSIEDIARLASTTRNYAWKLAHILVRKGWLQRVGRGRFIVNPPSNGPDPIPDMNPYRVGSRLVEPYYFAYATAANLHGFLLQAPRVYFIATPIVAIRNISQPAEFQLVRLDKRKFFGWQEFEKYGVSFLISDPERTVLDCIDRQDLCNGIAGVVQVVQRAGPRLDYATLERYVRKVGNRSLAQRLGYLVEHECEPRRGRGRFLESLRKLRGPAYVRLASASLHGTKGRYHSDWRVVVNVPEGVLRGEV